MQLVVMEKYTIYDRRRHLFCAIFGLDYAEVHNHETQTAYKQEAL